MPQKAPRYIESAGIIGASIKYKWSNDLAMSFDDAENVRLYNAIDKSNFKAKMAIGALLTEWIVWRFHGRADLVDAHNRIEAAWASIIDPAYVRGLDFELTDRDDFHDKAIVEGPLEIALDFLAVISSRYIEGSIYLAEPIAKQAMLAQHLMPNKKMFSSWLSDILRRTAKVFPREADYDEGAGIYDASHEKPVPREFFDPEFKYTDGAAEKALREFLQTLDPGKNPYLRTPEEMKALGFTGTPYSDMHSR